MPLDEIGNHLFTRCNAFAFINSRNGNQLREAGRRWMTQRANTLRDLVDRLEQVAVLLLRDGVHGMEQRSDDIPVIGLGLDQQQICIGEARSHGGCELAGIFDAGIEGFDTGFDFKNGVSHHSLLSFCDQWKMVCGNGFIANRKSLIVSAKVQKTRNRTRPATTASNSDIESTRRTAPDERP